MDYSILKDEELVLMCRQNDEEAFSCLTLRYISTAKVIAERYGDSSIEKACTQPSEKSQLEKACTSDDARLSRG